MYGKAYGMKETTVYLPEDLKASLERIARERDISEAALIREAPSDMVRSAEPLRPRLPLSSSEDPKLARRFGEELGGFGERR